ncbi:MAG: hypothetical protein IT438_10510 [Phycisphaerales bacterium]|nr:hypothetical protein [Phycisphaerales bacterium]
MNGLLVAVGMAMCGVMASCEKPPGSKVTLTSMESRPAEPIEEDVRRVCLVVDDAHDCKDMALRWTYFDDKVERNFRLVLGSKAAKEDNRKVFRELSESKTADSSLGNVNDGRLTWIEKGYVIADGRAPIVRGRRVRASSPGTQFIIEQLEQNGPERVYLVTTTKDSAGKVHKVEVSAIKADGTHKTLTLDEPDTWLEIDANGKFVFEVPKKLKDATEAQQLFVRNLKYLIGLGGCAAGLAESTKIRDAKTPLGDFARLFPNMEILFNPEPLDPTVKPGPAAPKSDQGAPAPPAQAPGG